MENERIRYEREKIELKREYSVAEMDFFRLLDLRDRCVHQWKVHSFDRLTEILRESGFSRFRQLVQSLGELIDREVHLTYRLNEIEEDLKEVNTCHKCGCRGRIPETYIERSDGFVTQVLRFHACPECERSGKIRHDGLTSEAQPPLTKSHVQVGSKEVMGDRTELPYLKGDSEEDLLVQCDDCGRFLSTLEEVKQHVELNLSHLVYRTGFSL